MERSSPVSYANKYVEKLAEMDRQGQPFVSVTLIETIGSTPQDAGSKMLVDGQGLAFGTVGGGRVELKAIQVAQEMLAETSPARSSSFVEWNLQRDVGMTCGGVVKLFFETFNRRHWHLVVFGAGHVAQALVRTLLHLDCQVTCIDSRHEWLARLPESPKLSVKQSDEPADEIDRLNENDFVICMTMGHRTDRPILKRVFQLQRRFAYLGVIGSQAKRKVLVRELTEDGIAPEWVEQFACPIGLPLGTNQPYEIAISITAQLIQRRDELARERVAT
jgi:xanthine dehydrogenase accessory factor